MHREYDAFKRQSEVLAKEVVECFKACNVEAKDIDKVVVADSGDDTNPTTVALRHTNKLHIYLNRFVE